MEFSCPKCGKSYRVPREKFAEPVQAAPCKECGSTLVFLKRPTADDSADATSHTGSDAPAGAPSGPSRSDGSAPGSPSSEPSPLERRRSRERTITWVLGLVLVVGVIAGTRWFVGEFKGSEAYQSARTYVEENERIQDMVGRQMDFDWFPEGEISGDEARFHFSVDGVQGEAEVAVRMSRTDREWRPVEASYEADGERGRLEVPGGAGSASPDGEGASGGLDVASSGDLPSITRAWRLLEEGEEDRALALIDRRVELEPENADAHYWRGRILSRMGRGDGAVEALRNAARIRPGYAEASRYLGFVLNSMGRHADATEALDEAIRLDPTDGWAHYNRGRAHFELGNRERALEDARRACELDHEQGCRVHRQLSGGNEEGR